MTSPEVVKIEGKERKTGRKAADTLRDAMRVPAVLYGPNIDKNIHFSVDERELENILSVSQRQIIELDIDGKTHKTLLKKTEFHPVTDRPIHLDLYALSDEHKVSLSVPIHLEGTPVGVSEGGGRIYQPMHILRIKVLPEDIPGVFTADISHLAIGENLHVRDLQLEGIVPLDELSRAIVTIRPPKSEELLTSALVTEELSEEELAEGEAAEGEAPAEGEEGAAEGDDEGNEDTK